MLHVIVLLASASVAVAVYTVVVIAVFSAALAVVPLVTTGVLSFTAVTVTVTVTSVVFVPSDARRVTRYWLFRSASAGASKSGATAKVRTPPAVMLKSAPSPPATLPTGVSSASASVAVAVYTVALVSVFSAALAVVPLVITGAASFTAVTVTVTVTSAVFVPSDARRVTRYWLFPSASAGAS